MKPFLSLLACGLALPAVASETARPFQPKIDLLSLHYDHAPDKDDGLSAAADRTLLQSLFGEAWLAGHTVAVSGAYGNNAERFDPESDAVMDAVWTDEAGGWLSAHDDRDGTVTTLEQRWRDTLVAGGDVWVKEGGQSDLTAAVVRRIHGNLPSVRTTRRIHVVQHSNWNEQLSDRDDLAFVQKHTDYQRIPDANRYLKSTGPLDVFVEDATSHPEFGAHWQTALDYFQPKTAVDFSDTGILMHILGLGEMDVEAFQERFF